MPQRLGDSRPGRTADSLEAVLHLAQLGHDGDGVSLAGSLLDLRVLIAPVSQPTRSDSTRASYLRPHEHIVLLLVADGELALRLGVVLRKGRQGLDRLAREDRHAKLGVGRGVLVARLERGQHGKSKHAYLPSLTKTRVSSGRAPNVTFSALCISSPLPSKNLPQPAEGQKLLV